MCPVKYFMKDKQELRNSLHLNNIEGACGAKLGCVSKPLGFVGFLTELSCPLTSCSLLSSSLLFSRVSSSLVMPMLLFFAAAHEKMLKKKLLPSRGPHMVMQ